MKKKTKLLTVMTIFVLVALLIVVAVTHKKPYDKCSATDRQQNNCVPTGRCTPPGDPREAFIDCALKNYDHKFSLEK